MGDVLPVTVGTLPGQRLTVAGIHDDSQAFGPHPMVDRALYEEAVPAVRRGDLRLLIKARPGADLTQLRADLVSLVPPYLVYTVQDPHEFADAQSGAIDNVLNLPMCCCCSVS